MSRKSNRSSSTKSPSNPTSPSPSPPPRKSVTPQPPKTPPKNSTPVPAAAKERPQSRFRDVAETAGAVAVGSTIGNIFSHTFFGIIHRIFGGSQPTQPDVAENPCAFELKFFLECTETNESNLQACEDLRRLLNECKNYHNRQR